MATKPGGSGVAVGVGVGCGAIQKMLPMTAGQAVEANAVGWLGNAISGGGARPVMSIQGGRAQRVMAVQGLCGVECEAVATILTGVGVGQPLVGRVRVVGTVEADVVARHARAGARRLAEINMPSQGENSRPVRLARRLRILIGPGDAAVAHSRPGSALEGIDKTVVVSQIAVRGEQAYAVAAVVEPEAALDQKKAVGGDGAARRNGVGATASLDIVNLPAAEVNWEWVGVDQFDIFALATDWGRQVFVNQNVDWDWSGRRCVCWCGCCGGSRGLSGGRRKGWRF